MMLDILAIGVGKTVMRPEAILPPTPGVAATIGTSTENLPGAMTARLNVEKTVCGRCAVAGAMTTVPGAINITIVVPASRLNVTVPVARIAPRRGKLKAVYRIAGMA